jgi:hypothetical protein
MGLHCWTFTFTEARNARTLLATRKALQNVTGDAAFSSHPTVRTFFCPVGSDSRAMITLSVSAPGYAFAECEIRWPERSYPPSTYGAIAISSGAYGHVPPRLRNSL